MKKLLPIVICAVMAYGCRTRPITPEESWADYCRYYSPTGETADPPTAVVDLRREKSARVQDTVAALKTQGYVELGTFKIVDGTDITQPAVMALAQKLNAGAVVWSTMNAEAGSALLPNPDIGIVGVDIVKGAHSMERPEAPMSEQGLVHRHEIWMLGKKAK